MAKRKRRASTDGFNARTVKLVGESGKSSGVVAQDLTLHALTMALRHRRPPPGLLHHSDRASQYASGDYRRALRAYGMACSMSRLGNSWDNVAESRFPTQVEPGVHDALWPTRAPAPTEVFEYIEAFYRGRGAHLFTARAQYPLTWLSTKAG